MSAISDNLPEIEPGYDSHRHSDSYAEDKVRLRHAMLAAGLREVRFRFDFEGTKVLFG